MKKSSKKGFTIVELVIVIAVIAILAAVMIPTFSGIITKARESAALQQATAQYKDVLGVTDFASIANDKNPDAYIKIEVQKKAYYFSVENGEIALVKNAPAATLYTGTEAAAAALPEGDEGYVSAKAVLGYDGGANVYVYAVCTEAAVEADVANNIEAAPAVFEMVVAD